MIDENKPFSFWFSLLQIAFGGLLTWLFAAPFLNGHSLHWLLVPLQATHTDLASKDETMPKMS